MSVRYLHISDLHLTGQPRDGEGWAASQFNQDFVITSLLAAIQVLDPPDLIFVSGDLAYSGKAAEYQVVEVFCQRLLAATGLPAGRLFLVPGNHDVDRSQIRSSHIPRLYQFQSENAITEIIGDPDMFPLLMRKFAAFHDFADRVLGRHVYTERDYFFAQPVAVSEGGREVVVNVAGLNSALFAGYDGDDKQKLALGLPQVNAALQKLDPHALLTIALFHHPFACFHPADRVCRNLLLQKADLILSGHLHEPDNVFLRDAAGQAVLIGAGASYERRDSENSFNVVDVDLETGRGQVQFYKYLPAFHRWKENTDANPNHPQGLFEFEIERLAGTSAARAAGRETRRTAGREPGIQAANGGVVQIGNNNIAFTGTVQGGVNIVQGAVSPPPGLDLAAVRDLLLDAFTAADLRRLVLYTGNAELHPLGREFADGDGLAAMVEKTIRFCQARDLLLDLLREVERENPRQYGRYAHRLRL